jgi:hydrogenase nickel incorporation protein HypA/HybF
VRDARSVESLLKTAVEAAGKGRRARLVRVLVGDGSGVRPAELETRFRELSRGTPAEGAELEFISEPIVARCARCGVEFAGAGLACPRCGGAELLFTAGTKTAVLTVDVDG